MPSRDDAFFVGKSNTIRAQRTGKLYFAVNDVLNDTNKDFPDMFLVDNIGFFYVRVTVTPADGVSILALSSMARLLIVIAP